MEREEDNAIAGQVLGSVRFVAKCCQFHVFIQDCRFIYIKVEHRC